jgi:aerobic carbon-monoxide dehydrogenase large subunit
MLHLGVVRSPHASARIARISSADAASLPGVVAVLSGHDLPEVNRPIPPYYSKTKFRRFEQQVIAKEIVRYVGEPVAVVLAETPAQVADAVEAVLVDYEPAPAVSSTDVAIQAGAPHVHENWPDNVAYVSRAVVGHAETAMGKSDEVVVEKFRHARQAGMPIETRGVLAYKDETGTLIVVSSTQVPYHVREAIADVLGFPAESLRVLAPDVGGGFGAKAQVHHEEILVPAMALRFGRPVKWVESRSEHFMATCHDREQIHDIRIGFKKDGTIVAIDDCFWADFGAYPVQEDGVTLNTL